MRGTDEGVAIARAEGLPQIGANASFTQQFGTSIGRRHRPRLTGRPQPDDAVVQRRQGAQRHTAADARVNAGRADLRTVEGDVFTDVVGAYMDVLRDEAIVSLNQGNVKVLETNLQASKDRFAVGDLTRTDVAQSEARLAGAHSQLASAMGKLPPAGELSPAGRRVSRQARSAAGAAGAAGDAGGLGRYRAGEQSGARLDRRPAQGGPL